MAAVAGIVWRLWARRSAGTCLAVGESPSVGARCECRSVVRVGLDRDWRDVVWLDTFDWAPVTNIDTRSARHVVRPGALRGRSPCTREGRIGPTAQLHCSGQWSVVRDGALPASGLIADWTWLRCYPRDGKGRPKIGMRRLNQPLMPVRVMPSMKARWARTKTMITGRMAIVLPAMARFQRGRSRSRK